MRNLFNFISRHHFFFLFLLLQVISFFLISQNNFYHRSIFINTTNLLTGNVYSIRNNFTEYFRLREINRQLAFENQILLEGSNKTFLATDQQTFVFRDTLYRKQYSYINTRVINNSIRNRNNYITLDKGRIHGIRPDMGIITSQGVIGIIKEVSANFSSALSFLHSDIQISSKHEKSDHIGTLLWEGYDYTKATMLYVPPHVGLEIGDTIITSGFSQIFPAGIILGTIADFEVRRGDNFFTIEIDLAQDFNNLQFVYVVKDLFTEEITNIESRARQN